MWKWILGVLGTVVAGLLLAYSTNLLGLNDRSGAEGPAVQLTSPALAGNKNSEPSEQPVPAKVVMGPLEIGSNRQGFDFDAFGQPAANAPRCAELCRTDSSCDAMTYVKSTGRCWLKKGVPAASADADMISSIKVKPQG